MNVPSIPTSYRGWLLSATAVAGLIAFSSDAISQSEPTPAPTPGAASGVEIALPTLSVQGVAPATQGYQALRSSSSTRTDTPLRDTPQSITVLPRVLLQDRAADNLERALRYTPGVGFAQGEGNRDTPVLRGQSTTADLFTDGIRDDAQYYRDLYNIDRLEILKGPNAMVFGRGGGGGVINRVTLAPEFGRDGSEVRLAAGSYGLARGTFDSNYQLNENFAARLTGLYQQADSYRAGVNYRTSAINPQLGYRIGDSTRVTLGYEYLRDDRVADRGVPSFNGRPLTTGVRTFFGDPNQSPTHTNVNAVNLFVEHDLGDGVTVRNRFRYATYDKFYQNIYPGAVAANGRDVSILAYNNQQRRDNVFNQTDVITRFSTGTIQHTLVTGMELGHQETANVRQSGFFRAANGQFTATSFTTSLANPRISQPLQWRPNATDANNIGTTNLFSLYAQDQVQILPQLQLITSFRYIFNDTSAINRRTNDRLASVNNLFAPRVGLVYRPIDPLTFYASYSVSYQPRAGDQLASLTLTNQALRPESFTNYEVGARWDVSPNLALTVAAYRLDRTNVAVADPADSSRLILVNGTRTRGVEVGIQGQVTPDWSVYGGYANQNGEISSNQSATVRRGNNIPFLSNNVISLWNRYDFYPRFGSYRPRVSAAVGVINQSGYYAATDNSVRIPGFTRVDAAVFWDVTDRYRVQVNAENLFGARYYPLADNNNNITPGAPFNVRASLAVRF